MSELPDKVMLWHNCLPLTHTGQWATTHYPEDAEEYVKVSALSSMVKPLDWYDYGDIKHPQSQGSVVEEVEVSIGSTVSSRGCGRLLGPLPATTRL